MAGIKQRLRGRCVRTTDSHFFHDGGSAGIGSIDPEARPSQRVMLALTASRKAEDCAASKLSAKPAFAIAAENAVLFCRAVCTVVGGVHPLSWMASSETVARAFWRSDQRS